MNNEISFIDTNIFLYALAYQKVDVLAWIGDVYRNIYVHIDVLDELEVYAERTRIENAIAQRNWTLFDPKNYPSQSMICTTFSDHRLQIICYH